MPKSGMDSDSLGVLDLKHLVVSLRCTVIDLAGCGGSNVAGINYMGRDTSGGVLVVAVFSSFSAESYY